MPFLPRSSPGRRPTERRPREGTLRGFPRFTGDLLGRGYSTTDYPYRLPTSLDDHHPQRVRHRRADPARRREGRAARAAALDQPRHVPHGHRRHRRRGEAAVGPAGGDSRRGRSHSGDAALQAGQPQAHPKPTIVEVGEREDRRRPPGDDRRAVRRRSAGADGRDRRGRSQGRREHPPRRRLQAAHQPLLLSRARRRGAEDPPRRRRPARPAGRHRGGRPAARRADRASTPT